MVVVTKCVRKRMAMLPAVNDKVFAVPTKGLALTNRSVAHVTANLKVY